MVPGSLIYLTNLRRSTNRNWRYHKELKQWLTKDVSYPEPTPISPEAERGFYVFFDPTSWQRTRVSHTHSPNFYDGMLTEEPIARVYPALRQLRQPKQPFPQLPIDNMIHRHSLATSRIPFLYMKPLRLLRDRCSEDGWKEYSRALLGWAVMSHALCDEAIRTLAGLASYAIA